MAPKLEHVFTMRGYLSKEHSIDLGAMWASSGPKRSIVPIISGTIEGSGLKATILPGGSDWLLMDPDSGVAHLDVRTQAKTDDGETVYVHYTGVLKADEATGKITAWANDAKSTNYGDHQWFSAPIMETNSKQHKWVETTLFVGQGRWIVDDQGSAVEYEIYKVTN